MLKPVVLMTVHRKYFPMIANIKRYQTLKEEFSVAPSLVLIWADPIEEDEWIFETLLSNGYVDHVLYRSPLKDDLQMGTTYPESININLGLRFIHNHFNNAYCLMQAHDIFLYENSYREIDSHMQKGYDALVFDWVKWGCYSTNCFAVSMNPAYWPPVSEPLILDGLERMWWLKLGQNPANVKAYKDSNHIFKHTHNYESQIAWLRKFKVGYTSPSGQAIPVKVPGDVSGRQNRPRFRE